MKVQESGMHVFCVWTFHNLQLSPTICLSDSMLLTGNILRINKQKKLPNKLSNLISAAYANRLTHPDMHTIMIMTPTRITAHFNT